MTVDFFRNIVNSLNSTHAVLSSVTDGVYNSIELTNLNNLYLGQTITDNTTKAKYQISAIDCKTNTIKIKTSNIVTNISFEYPKFFYGTVIDFNNEIVNMPFKEKLPCIYLHERFDETYNGDSSYYYKEGSYDLYFLTDADFGKWSNEIFKTKAIEPMSELAELFIGKLKEDRGNVSRIESYKKGNRQRFASYVDSKGEIQKDIQDSLSGVKLTIDLKFKKVNCNC